MGPGRIYRLAWIFYLFLALGGAIWIGWGNWSQGGQIPAALFFDKSTWWLDLALGLGLGGMLLALWEGLRHWVNRARELEDQLSDVLGPLESGEAISLALISGFSEELFFRGAVQGTLGFTVALVVFTLLHTGPGRAFRLWTGFAALAGALLGGLMIWRGNLLAPVAAHALVNAVNLRRLARHGAARAAASEGAAEALADGGGARGAEGPELDSGAEDEPTGGADGGTEPPE
jgi:membrane protease YdiL (CAAX protease family)